MEKLIEKPDPRAVREALYEWEHTPGKNGKPRSSDPTLFGGVFLSKEDKIEWDRTLRSSMAAVAARDLVNSWKQKPESIPADVAELAKKAQDARSPEEIAAIANFNKSFDSVYGPGAAINKYSRVEGVVASYVLGNPDPAKAFDYTYGHSVDKFSMPALVAARAAGGIGNRFAESPHPAADAQAAILASARGILAAEADPALRKSATAYLNRVAEENIINGARSDVKKRFGEQFTATQAEQIAAACPINFGNPSATNQCAVSFAQKLADRRNKDIAQGQAREPRSPGMQ